MWSSGRVYVIAFLLCAVTAAVRGQTIVITAAPTYAYYGENVTLVCTVFGDLSDPLIWEVPTNSTSLSRGNIDNGSMDSILTFIAFEDDSGVYSCRHADFITSIIVTIVPAILSGPVNMTLEYSDDLTATLTCTAFGGNDAVLDFAWYYANSAAEVNVTSERETLNPDNSTTSTIIITLTLDDRESEYTCYVEYAGSSDGNQETATLSIVPAIVENPQSILSIVGRNASFTCTAYGGPLLLSPSLVFTWRGPVGVDISNVETLDTDNDRITSVLTLVNVTEDYDGNYSCSVAYSDMSEIMSTSETATLGVILIAPEFLLYIEQSTYNIDEGDGNVTVCAELVLTTGEFLQDIVFSVVTVNGSAESPDDFISVSTSLTFSAGSSPALSQGTVFGLGSGSGSGSCVEAGFDTCCDSGCLVGNCFCSSNCHSFNDCCDDIQQTCPGYTECISISIVNDEFQEPDIEQFTVSASTADASVSIENATAVVFIFDDDNVPTITNISENITARIGEDVTLNCTARGDGALSVIWQNPVGHSLSSEAESSFVNSILTITNISAADGGTYACIAENDAGSVNSSVTVYIAPYFTFQPKDVLTTNGSIVNITCVAEAFPPPTLYWEILIEYGSGSGYGGVLMPSEAYEEFNPVVFGDEGVYQCVALNDFGKNTTSVYVTVSPEGSVLVTSNRVVYEEGDNATLTCTHLGGPGNTLQWLRDGKTLENSTNPTLAVTRISAKRSGEVYTCLVTNLAGEGSANLTLNIAPVILLHPQDAFTDNNSRVEFECSASGYPEPEYEWVKVGGSLPVTALVAENGSLIITEVNFGDEGVYFCTTTSNGITVSSNRSFLTISPHGSVRVSPHNSVFHRGQSPNLTCIADGGPGNTYQWALNGSVLENEVSESLLLSSITALNNGGTYTCSVSNGAGNSSNSTSIFVYPLISLNPSDSFTEYGVEASFFCDATAYPYPEFEWFKDGGRLPNGVNGSDTSWLRVTPSPNDGSEGEYYCRATSNGMSVESQRATLFVSPEGTVTISVEVVYMEQDDVILPCESLGGPENYFQWFKNGITFTSVQNDTTNISRLYLFNVTALRDGAVYTCVVINPAGMGNTSISLNIAPIFMQLPTDIFTENGTTVSFMCLATAYPEPTYLWYKTGGTLPVSAIGDNSPNLTFSLVHFEDEGSYYCTATSNGIPLESPPAFLLISPANGVTIFPDNDVLYSGETVVLRCLSEAELGVTFQWSFNSTLLEDQRSENLTLIEATANVNGGSYSCNVSNAAGSGMYTTNLFFSPVVTVNPVSDGVTNNTLIFTVTCNAIAYPAPQYNWFRVNNSLPNTAFGSNTTTLTISPVVFGDEGAYYCTATANSMSAKSDFAILYISPLGSVMLFPPGLEVYSFEDNVTFYCLSQGGPYNTFSWALNGVTVPFETPFLHIESVAISDAGEYTCTVSNNAGQGNATTVLFLEPRIVSRPSDIRTRVNDSVRFTCTAEGFPPPTITWECIDCEELELGSGISSGIFDVSLSHPSTGVVIGTLELLSVSYSDYGQYSCLVNSTVATRNFAIQSTATLSVSPAGSVRVSPSLIYALVNASVMSNCTAEGGPNNQFSWSIILGRDRVTIQEGPVLMIDVTSVNQNILYYCDVENDAGNGEAIVTIYSNIAPVITVPPYDTNVTTTEDLDLTCLISGFPIPLIEWYHNGSVISPDERITILHNSSVTILTVINTSLADSGDYRCSGINDVGSVFSPPALVLIQDRPEKPIIVSAVNITSTSLVLEWLEPHHNNAPVLGFRVMYSQDDIDVYMESETEQETLYVNQLLPGLAYQFTVVAFNDIGNSVMSDPFYATTLEEAPTGPPENVMALVLSSIEIMVQWTVVPIRARNGIISQYEVQYVPYVLFEGQISTESVTTTNMSTVLVNLQEYVSYEISVRAHNSAGAGPFSENIKARTLEDAPSAPPTNVMASGVSPTSITVIWNEVPEIHQNGIIRRYNVEVNQTTFQKAAMYQSLFFLPTTSVVNITFLEAYTEYSIRVRAYNTGERAGPFSDVVLAVTHQDSPTASPSNLTVRDVTSTVIELMWEEVPAIDQNGIITVYEVEYTQSTFDPVPWTLSVIVEAPALTTNLTALEAYVTYSIRIRALTAVGPGPYSSFTNATTSQDFPSMPPTNFTATVINSTSIEVMWEPVPLIDQNGVITRYEVEYVASMFSTIALVNYTLALTINLTGLEEYAEYSIRIRAHTVVGAGPFSQPVTVTTNEDAPSMPPTNFTATVISPTSIEVMWEPVPLIDQNGVITRYEVEYVASMFSTLALVNYTLPSTLAINLTGLEEYVEYSIRTRAHTTVGAGPFSQPVTATTLEDVPASPPARVEAFSTSSSSIRIVWDEVPAIDRNGIITMYEIEYSQSGDAVNTTELVDPDMNVLDLNDLEDFGKYRIRVRAYTEEGPGPYSATIEVAEEQKAPSSPPLNVSSQTLSSSTIQVTWNEVPALERNGIITKYQVEYNQTAFSSVDSSLLVFVDEPTLMTTLVDLHEYTEYVIRVRAYTSEGPGPYSNETVSTTLQDRPTAPPQNVVSTSKTSTSLLVSWDPVPAIHQNGLITQYDIEYNQSTFLQLSSSLTETVAADNMSILLNGLEEYVIYSVRVRGHTSIGAGPYSSSELIQTLEDVPSSYPVNIMFTPLSPTEVRLQWGPVSEIDRNGIVTRYEVLFNQTSIDTLPMSGTNFSDSELSATVGPLQPFITYTLSVRAHTSIGPGPFNPVSVIAMTNPSGLSLSINDNLVVKEGDDLNITCQPPSSSSTVGLEWEITIAASSDGTVVDYDGPLRHTVIIRNANINHQGNYTCRVVGDREGVIPSATTSVKVREKCLEDFAGGLFWEVAFDGDPVRKPCRDIDNSFSLVVKVYRRCMARREWTSVDFSGCTLESDDQQVIVIVSLWAIISSNNDESQEQIDIMSLKEQLIAALSSGGVESSLEQLPQTIDQHFLLLWKVFYNTDTEAEGSGFDSVVCSEDDLTLASSTVSIERAHIAAIMQSDFCECRQVLQTQQTTSGNGGSGNDGNLLEPRSGCSADLDIQQLCSGTLASPCNCELSQECQCVSPYVGDGSLCVLDSDADIYPDQALKTCTDTDTQTYCSADTCPNAPNPDQADTSPCIGLITDCPADVDEVWNIQWPYTPAEMIVTVSCGVDFVGNAMRMCRSDFTWDPPDVTNCQSRIFVDIMERADIALNNENTEEVLAVVEELVQATAAEDMAQLPQDLDTTNDIITSALDLLFDDLDTAENDTNATTVDATAIFETLDNILSESNQASFDSLQEEGVGSQAVLKNAEAFGLYAARVLDQQMGPGQTVNITGENMALRAQSIAVDEDVDYSFPSREEVMQLSLPMASLANISLPSALLEERASGQRSVVVASVLFTTLQSFLPSASSSSSRSVGGEAESLVISSQIAVEGQDGKMTNLMEDSLVTINFQFLLEDMQNRIVQCAFWDFGNSSNVLAESGWSEVGVTTERVTYQGGSANVQCSSSHLTSFACLVDVRGAQISNKALSVVSYTGLCISMVCLLLTIIFFVRFGKKLFKSAVHNFVHLNLAIALFAGYLVFAVGVELAARNEIGCKAVTALIQYFFLSAFSWMMCEGVMLYLKLVVIFSTLKDKWWFFMLLGWGIPLPFVAIGLGSVHNQYGVKDSSGELQYCWLSSGNGSHAIWTFVAPMLAIILINVVFLVLALRNIYKNRMSQRKVKIKGKKESKEREVAKSLLKAVLALLPLLGLTWVFGLFAVNENTELFAWLFTIFNSLQGFFIFFFFVMRDKKVSGKIKSKYSVYSSSLSVRLGSFSSTLRRPSKSTPESLTLSSMRGSKSSSTSESESEWRSESIIVRNPLPVIFEGEEVELKFGESDQESVFGADDIETEGIETKTEGIESECIVKVNLATTDVK